MVKALHLPRLLRKFTHSTLRVATLSALPIAGYAAIAFAAPPAARELTDSQLRYEAIKSLAATIGNCGVSANVLALTALADSLPGISVISKAAVNDDEDSDNEVQKSKLQTDQSVQTGTVIMGGILSIPIEIIVDAVDFLRDGSVIDGERAENQLGDQLSLGYAATREILKTKMGENSKCRVNGERFESIIYEMSERYYASHPVAVAPKAAPAQIPVQTPERVAPPASSTIIIIDIPKESDDKNN